MFVFAKGKPLVFNPVLICCVKPKATTYDRLDAGGNRRTNSAYAMSGRERIKGNVWRFAVGGSGVTGDSFSDAHPAPFPAALAEDHVLSWSNAGDIVLDPMAGSGTVAKMAIKHHRRFIGIDISQEYVDLAQRRIGAVQPVMLELAV